MTFTCKKAATDTNSTTGTLVIDTRLGHMIRLSLTLPYQMTCPCYLSVMFNSTRLARKWQCLDFKTSGWQSRLRHVISVCIWMSLHCFRFGSNACIPSGQEEETLSLRSLTTLLSSIRATVCLRRGPDEPQPCWKFVLQLRKKVACGVKILRGLAFVS